MDRSPYCFNLLTHFSVINVVKKLRSIKQLTIEIESNSCKHSLILIAPWPPYGRASTELNSISGLSVENIDCILAFKDSDNRRVEIKKKDRDIISICCRDIKGLPNRSGICDQTT